MRFDLPDPFGPMTQVKLKKGPIRCIPAYDLKFSSSIYVTGMLVFLVARWKGLILFWAQ